MVRRHRRSMSGRGRIAEMERRFPAEKNPGFHVVCWASEAERRQKVPRASAEADRFLQSSDSRKKVCSMTRTPPHAEHSREARPPRSREVRRRGPQANRVQREPPSRHRGAGSRRSRAAVLPADPARGSADRSRQSPTPVLSGFRQVSQQALASRVPARTRPEGRAPFRRKGCSPEGAPARQAAAPSGRHCAEPRQLEDRWMGQAAPDPLQPKASLWQPPRVAPALRRSPIDERESSSRTLGSACGDRSREHGARRLDRELCIPRIPL